MTNVETAMAELITWKQVCKECGGDNITALAWLDPNKLFVANTYQLEWEGNNDCSQYCYDCEENVKFVEVEIEFRDEVESTCWNCGAGPLLDEVVS